MTTTDTEASIKSSVAAIATHWDALLAMATPSGHAGGGSRGTLITAEDHADTDADIDRTTRVMSLRRFTTDVLNGWCRIVLEDRIAPTLGHLSKRERDEYLTKVLPNGSHVPSMAGFLDTHAQWMSGHEAAQDCADELAVIAGKVGATVTPSRKEWISLGSCPVEVEFDPERGVEVCAGQVRAWPRAEDREGETMARCRRCGTEAVASWWERQMFTNPELRQWLTDADLVPFLHSTFGIVVKEATIRQWVRREVLKPSGSDEKGRRLFNREAVIWAVDRKVARERMGA